MKFRSLASLLPLCAASLAGPPAAADGFAAAGTKATLSVDYFYESAGRKQDRIDLHEWRVHRSASLVATLAAQPPSPLPTMQALDAAQSAALNAKTGKGQAAAAKLAPMMASVEQIMARCGDDEACITHETSRLGSAMAGTSQLNQTLGAKADIDAMAGQVAPRYQAWQALSQQGRYRIDETAHIVHGDPICMSLPRARCTRDERREGAGDIPLPPQAKKSPQGLPGVAAFEVDRVRQTITLVLPVPLMPLPYTETITTDEPAGTHSTPTPKGPQPRQLAMRTSAGSASAQPMTVPLQGSWRSQTGERVVQLAGQAGESGRLTIRWRLTAP